MSVNATIEDRLAAVEAAVAELQKHRLIQTPAPDWLVVRQSSIDG